jgi:hypothetical protein
MARRSGSTRSSRPFQEARIARRSISTAIDITDRHKAEIELRRYATYLAEAEKLSHTGFWAWNTKTGELFGPTRNGDLRPRPGSTQLSHQVLLDLVHPEDRAALEEDSLRAVRDKLPFDTLFRLCRATARSSTFTVSASRRSRSQARWSSIGVTMDETEQARQRRHAQGAGGRAGGAAHDHGRACSFHCPRNRPAARRGRRRNAALRWQPPRPMWKRQEACSRPSSRATVPAR